MIYLNSKLKDLDNFQRIPKEYKESTLLGALLSMVCLVSILYLSFTSTFNFFVKRDQSSEFQIHKPQKGEMMEVNIAIKLFRLPCEMVSLDLMDKMGRHQLHIGQGLYSQPLDSFGKPLESDPTKVKDINMDTHDNGKSLNFKKIVERLKNNEGCYLQGNFQIEKVPGNFHISSHAQGYILRKLFSTTEFTTIDLSHQIIELYFGTAEEKKHSYKHFYYPNIEALTKFHDKTSGQIQSDPGLFHEYYLKIVPSFFIKENNKFHYNQYSANHQSYHTEQLPAIYFKYELSPIEMMNVITKERIYQYIVDMCAIIGGVYTMAKFIDGVLHQGIKTIRAKARMGKLQ